MQPDAQQLALLRRRATSGDPVAQFSLAEMMAQLGDSESRLWLGRAAVAGHPEAIVSLVAEELQGADFDPVAVRKRLLSAARAGSNNANRLLANLTVLGVGDAADWGGAIRFVVTAARAGDQYSLCQLGFLLEMAAPASPLATAALAQAVRGGHGLAAFALAGRRACGGEPIGENLSAWMAALMRTGHPLAQRFEDDAATTDKTPEIDNDRPELDWAAIVEMLARPPGIDERRGRRVAELPPTVSYEKLLTAEECDYLIGLAAPGVRRVAHADVGPELAGNAQSAALSLARCDLVVHALKLRMGATAGVSLERAGDLEILCFRAAANSSPLRVPEPQGTPARTLLVCLNSEFQGGETHLSGAGMKLRGRVGDAIAIERARDDGVRSLPVTDGVKWLAGLTFA
jgi:hypothetical protein